MTTAFRMALHSIADGRRIVEVYDGGIFIAAIYPTDDARTFRIMSKHSISVIDRDVGDVDVRIGGAVP